MCWQLSLGEAAQPGQTAMSTIHGTTEFGTATARRQYYSPLEAYWDAFREWRKREKLRSKLDALSDRELLDIGIGRGEVDYAARNRAIDPRGAVLAS